MYYISIRAPPPPRTHDSGAMKFTILEEAIFLIIAMYLVHGLNVQEQRGTFLKK